MQKLVEKVCIKPIKNHPVSLLALIVFLIVSCGQNRQKAQFPEPVQLTAQPVNDISLLTKGNVYLAVADTFLIVQKTEAPVIQIYSSNTHKLLAAFGRQGRGPGEFGLPSLLKQVDFDPANNSPIVYIFDARRKIINTINIRQAIDSLEVTTQESQPSGRYWLTNYYHKDENFYIGAPNRDGRIIIQNNKTSQDTVIPYIPKQNFAIPEQRLPIVYGTTAYVNIDKELIAAAPSRLGQLDFFDLQGNHLNTTVFDPVDDEVDKFSGDSDAFSSIKHQIIELDAKDGLLYGLNANTIPPNLYDPELEYNMKVQVFNWDGEAIKEYLLDDRMIFSIAVDPIHKRIYAYAPLETEYNIITYSMK